ncbi:MAG: DUF418 domain-containing protein [Chitinophagaceae bacterium]
MSSSTGTAVAAPVLQSERIDIIDGLRGFAILGILLMNIPGFSLAGPAGFDPSVYNESGINFKVWHFVEWFPEGTQRAIFSMLFGAGILLFTSRQELRVDGVKPADYFFRRQLWLMVFGLINIYVLLWWGDILFDYACYGMIMFTFRKLSPKSLLIGAGVCLLLMTARENRDLYLDKKMINKGEIVAAIDTTKTTLTEQQKEDLGAMTDFKENATQEKKLKNAEKAIRKTTGDYESVYEFRTAQYINRALIRYTYMGVWDVLLFMFLGMAFFKSGILTGKASAKTYWILAILGLGLGLVISYFRIQPVINYKFNWFEYTKNTSFEYYTISRTFRALGIFALIMLMYKSGWFKWLFVILQPVGQMAFTNYLTQSLLCAIIFYGGIGFGFYGKLQRHEVYYVVGAIWLLQITWSNIWLRYFQFGPLEWAWRSLTYWKKQPLRKKL